MKTQLENSKSMENDINKIDPDIRHELYHAGFKAAKDHDQPSPKTIEMINGLETRLNEIHTALYGVEGEGGLIKLIKSIDDQTKKTNGRVSKMELWKYGLTTAYTVAVGIIMFFFVYFALPAYNTQANLLLNLDKQITTHIAKDTTYFNKLIKE